MESGYQEYDIEHDESPNTKGLLIPLSDAILYFDHYMEFLRQLNEEWDSGDPNTEPQVAFNYSEIYEGVQALRRQT